MPDDTRLAIQLRRQGEGRVRLVTWEQWPFENPHLARQLAQDSALDASIVKITDRPRLLDGADFLVEAGPRITAEFLVECARAHDDIPAMLNRLDAWRHFPLEVLREVGRIYGGTITWPKALRPSATEEAPARRPKR